MKILLRPNHEKRWRPVASAAYAKEGELQDLLAENPEVISIDEIRPDAGPLVYALREVGLPIGSMDLLAFTARGDIAVIECKLAANPEVKRKVIGQALEYGANLWEKRYDELDALVQAREGQSLAELVRLHVESPDWDEEEFRKNIEDALACGSFMLIIVVDQINDELSRIVRFMNAAGSGTYDFAALEMRRFHAENAEMLVPRLFGPTRTIKPPPPGIKRKWDEPSLMAELNKRAGPESVAVANRILEWAKANSTDIWWGEGKEIGSFVPVFQHNNFRHALFAVYTSGGVEIYFQWYQYKPIFDSEIKRLELRDRLNTIPGVKIPTEAITRRPPIPISSLVKEENLHQFLATFDWFIAEVKKS